MNHGLRAILVSAVICEAAVSAPPPDHAALEAVAQRRNCEWQEDRRVAYAGPSEALGACLEKLARTGPIDELRVTSGGGDAWVTLQTAQALRGRLNLLVIDGLCASSCANYLLPAAQRVRVEPGSYVLLHGSMSLRDVARQHEAIRESVRAQARKQASPLELSDAQVEALAQQAIDQVESDLAKRIPVQETFARQVLACDDWLDPRAHFDGQEPAKGIAWLMVTPEMAARCLKETRIDAFWAPEAQAAFNPELGFFRALK